MTETRSICVFCGSSEGTRPEYMLLAQQTGQQIAQHNYRLVYGGGGTGLMGATARAVHEAQGDVLGIIPEFLVKSEHMYEEVPTQIVPNMHVRKMAMYEHADAFIVLPGGVGTLEEAIEIMSWGRLQLHHKPMVFLSSSHYWDKLFDMITHTIDEGFTPEWMREDLILASSPEEAITRIQADWSRPHKPTRPVAPVSKM